MNRKCTLNFFSRLAGSVAFFFITTLQAGIPLWSFDPMTDTEFSISSSGSAIVRYRVTNQSSRLHTLQMSPIVGITQITTPGNCLNPFRLGYHQSCILSLQVNAANLQGNVVGGPVVCEQGNPQSCYQPAFEDILKITVVPVPGSTTLSPSVNLLTLQTSGVTRIITITNTGSASAYNVRYTPSVALPAGTSISPTSCGTIPPGGNCVLRITPGASPSATPGDTNPIPIVLTVKGNNTNTLIPRVNIFTFGNVYQSGYLFVIDDTTPIRGSIGGKVAALTDQSAPMTGIIWSSNGSGPTTPDAVSDNIPGIFENSVAPPCNGNSNGACNTNVIVTYYSPPTTNPAVNLAFYAAGLCSDLTTGGYSNWYLPSICEMGYDTTSAGSGCSTGAPAVSNMQSSLIDNNIGGFLGVYWSSTESSSAPVGDSAWAQLYNPGVANLQGRDDKFDQRGVRCVRVVTPQ